MKNKNHYCDMDSYTIIIGDGSEFRVAAQDIDFYPTIGNIARDSDEKTIVLPYVDSEALNIVFTEDVHKIEYPIDVYLRLVQAIDYLGQDEDFQYMIKQMQLWPSNEKMLQKLRGQKDIVLQHMNNLSPWIIESLLEPHVIYRYIMPQVNDIHFIGHKILHNSKGDVLIAVDNVRQATRAEIETEADFYPLQDVGMYSHYVGMYLYDGRTGKTITHFMYRNVLLDELGALSNDRLIHTVYYAGNSGKYTGLVIHDAGREDMLIYNIISQTGPIYTKQVLLKDILKSSSAQLMASKLSMEGRKIFIYYFDSSENKHYYTVVNSKEGTVLWSKELTEKVINVFPSPSASFVFVQHQTGQYSIDNGKGDIIVIQNPALENLILSSYLLQFMYSLHTPSGVPPYSYILFSPQEDLFLETTIVLKTVKSSRDKYRYFASRLITMTGEILLTHIFDEQPLALGKNFIITMESHISDTYLNMWPIVRNPYHIKNKITMAKNIGSRLLSINITPFNVVNMKLWSQRSGGGFMLGDISIRSTKINVYHDIEQYVEELTGGV